MNRRVKYSTSPDASEPTKRPHKREERDSLLGVARLEVVDVAVLLTSPRKSNLRARTTLLKSTNSIHNTLFIIFLNTRVPVQVVEFLRGHEASARGLVGRLDFLNFGFVHDVAEGGACEVLVAGSDGMRRGDGEGGDRDREDKERCAERENTHFGWVQKRDC